MGRSVTPTFRVEVLVRHLADNVAIHWTPASWRVRDYGRPNARNLARWVFASEQATQPGGCNAHLGVTVVTMARIVRQSNDATVAQFERCDGGRNGRVEVLLRDGGDDAQVEREVLPLPVKSWDAPEAARMLDLREKLQAARKL